MKPYLYSFLVFILCSCCGSKNNTAKHVNMDSLKDPLVNANKLSVKRESDEIDQYVKFKKWEVVTTGTGIRYMIYQAGKGNKAQTGNMVKINYTVSLLDGTLCYSSDKKGAREFLIGQDNVESGLHEALTYMRAGDKAKVILPSHLAFGLTGDNNKIPPRASVLYDIELFSFR